MITSLPDGNINMVSMEYQRGPLDPKVNSGKGRSVRILESLN